MTRTSSAVLLLLLLLLQYLLPPPVPEPLRGPPDPDGGVVGHGDEDARVHGVPRHAVHSPGVSGQAHDGLRLAHVVHVHLVVLAAAGDEVLLAAGPAGAAEAAVDGVEALRDALELAHQHPLLHVPQVETLVGNVEERVPVAVI